MLGPPFLGVLSQYCTAGGHRCETVLLLSGFWCDGLRTVGCPKLYLFICSRKSVESKMLTEQIALTRPRMMTVLGFASIRTSLLHDPIH